MQDIIDNLEYIFAVIAFALFGSILTFPDMDDDEYDD
jgi:hypothetical protein